ncbi:MAG: helix-turn-helix domain-containing protein [Chloroflexi bacterium]|nr:helix-turn-helix domain-containing protein [Chloroflexota bacterium]
MIGQRLRRLRLSRRLSLESLAATMGGIVTKQALSKYELDRASPSPYILSKLAMALGTNASYFFAEPGIRAEFVAYRKKRRLLDKDKKALKALIEQALEDRVRILELVGQGDGARIPVRHFKVKEIGDAEKAAEELRDKWQLGLGPIQNAVSTLEDNLLSVLGIEANEDFDGISAIVYDKEDNVKTVALVTRCGIAGERQRLNLTHELGHLVLDIGEDVDEEKAAFRFGAAFLAPAPKIFQEVGRKRALVQLPELLLLKRQFGLSIQALVHRLHDLKIITDSYYQEWFMKINRYGWRKQEPEEWPFEQSPWLKRNILRLIAEGLMTQADAERILGEKVELERPTSVTERRAFLKLPVEKRREILSQQASNVARFYAEDREWPELEGGDLVE